MKLYNNNYKITDTNKKCQNLKHKLKSPSKYFS